MAWWLAYEELYGDMDKEYPIMNKNDDEEINENNSFNFSYEEIEELIKSMEDYKDEV